MYAGIAPAPAPAPGVAAGARGGAADFLFLSAGFRRRLLGVRPGSGRVSRRIPQGLKHQRRQRHGVRLLREHVQDGRGDVLRDRLLLRVDAFRAPQNLDARRQSVRGEPAELQVLARRAGGEHRGIGARPAPGVVL